MFRVIFLGTGGSLPTRNRNPSSILINRDGELLFFDCGEGSQKQMMKAKTGMMALSSIYLTHFHADHILGIPGLVQTMSFQGRTEPLDIYGPPHIHDFVKMLIGIGYYKLRFDVRSREVAPGEIIHKNGYDIEIIKTKHSVPSVGYVLREHVRPGKFDRDKAIELGVPVGPMFSQLQKGFNVIVNGNRITPGDVLGPSRPGRTVVYSGDTRPTEDVERASKGADLLIHEATLAEDKKEWARESMHSTSVEAARLAADANVERLILTHISSRYTDDISPIYNEAKQHFKSVIIASDLMEIDIPYKRNKVTE